MIARNTYKNEYVEYLTSEECSDYLRKFRGTLIFRGRSSLSYRWFDKIRLYYKNYFWIDVDFPIRKSLLQIMPVVGLSSIKRGKRIQKVPILLNQRRRYALINNWIIRKQKDTTNVRGVKIKSIGEELMNSFFLKSKTKVYRDDYTKDALKARYLLMRRGKTRVSPGFSSFKDKIIERDLLKENLPVFRKRRISDIDRFLNAMYFIEFKKKNWFIRKKFLNLRNFMLETWNETPENRILALGQWVKKNKIKQGRSNRKPMGLVTIANILKRYEKKGQN